MSNRAWVTLATNDSYGLGALVLAHSLRRNGSPYPAVVLITPSVTDAMRDRLSAVFSEVITVDVLDSRDATHLALLQRPELGITFTKIHCWNLTQFEKCVFLDADTLVIQNCDELFEREELSAAPDVGWPDCFNSGVFVYKPSAETFSRLVNFAQERGSFDGGDQGLLNSFFSDWARGDINKHLPFLYNVTSAAFYSYIPALKHYGQNLKIIHFIGATKPWLQQYNWDSKSVNAPDHLKDFLQLWWDIFVGQVHQQLDTTMVEVDQETAEATPELPPQDVLQYYAPTLDPESEFSWHHPDENETKLEENTYDLDVSNFYDPWEHRRGNIPPNLKGDVWQHLDPDNSYQNRHQWEQQQYSQPEQTYQHVSSSTDNRQSQNVGPSHSFHGEQQHMGPGSIQNHIQQNYHYENQDEQNNRYKLNTDSYSHTSQDNHECTHDNYNQEVSNHQHYSELEHSHFHHHHDYQEPTHQQNHTQHESSHEYHHNEHHHHHSHTHNNEQVNDSPNNFPLKELLNHASEHTHSNKQSHTPTHYLAHLKQKQPQYVYCVHLDHSKPRKKRQNNLKRVEITVTKEMMDGCISEEETEDCDDIIPRHPYDGFYLRHRITINSRGKKVCTHEIPPIPSPPSTPTVDKVQSSDTPELLLDVDNTSNHEDSSSMVSQEQTGVAGNLARVSASPVDAQREAIDELARRQGWEAGNIDYMGADSFDNIWAKISETLNQPRASPPKEAEVLQVLPTSKDQVAPAVEPSSQPTEVAVEAAGDPISVQSELLLEPEAKQEDAKTAEGIKTIQTPSEHAASELKPVESEVKAKASQEIETAIEVTEAPIAELKKSGETLKKVEEPKPVEALSLSESPKLADTSKTVEVPKLAEVSKPAEAPQVPEVPKSVEAPRSVEAPKAAEIPMSAEVAKSAEAPKPVETLKSNEAPKSVEAPQYVEAPQSAATLKSPEMPKVVEAPKAAEVTKPVKAPKPSDTTKPEQAKSPKVEIKKTEPLAVPPTPPTSPKSTPELDSPSESSIPEPVKIAEANLASEIDKETSALLQASDSPPLANTPSKEEAPSTPGAKSEEKRRPAGKLRLSPPQSAPALPTPDSEAEDAATLATAIIAGELTPQPSGLTKSPLGPTSVAQIGVKPKTKPSTADCIESSVSEAKQSETPKKKVVKKVVKKDGSGTEAPVPPPRKKEKKPKDK